MNREQLEHAIRAACTIIESDRVYVVGSQSILGSYGDADLPAVATDSNEVDIWPLGDDDAERLAEKLFVIGEMSDFHEQHGFYVDGVGKNTAVLPDGWDSRLVEVLAQRLDGVRVVGLCLDPHDLCVAKLIANRDKDRAFVLGLAQARLIDPNVLLERLSMTAPPLDADGEERDINHAWVFAQSLLDVSRLGTDSIEPNGKQSGGVLRGKSTPASTGGSFRAKGSSAPSASL